MSQIILSFFDMDLWSCSLGSRRESRPAAETRRAEAIISELEDVLIESLVLESEMVAGSEQLK